MRAVFGSRLGVVFDSGFDSDFDSEDLESPLLAESGDESPLAALLVFLP